MNGVLLIDKPAGMTSHDVVARARRALRTKRVGHTGTLDPFATGVLVLLIGPATRLARFLDKDEKEYVADVRFGSATDTGDRTGSTTETGGGIPSMAELAAACEKFIGTYQQTPPMYSAKKIGGKKLYELARRGESVEREPVAVTISALNVIGRLDDETFRVGVTCSAGTYILTLAEDIARSLRTNAHLTELRRIRAGRFSITDAADIAQLNVSMPLISPNDAMIDLPTFTLSPERVQRTLNGLSTRYRGTEPDGTFFKMLTPEGELAAIGVFNEAENVIQPKIVLV